MKDKTPEAVVAEIMALGWPDRLRVAAGLLEHKRIDFALSIVRSVADEIGAAVALEMMPTTDRQACAGCDTVYDRDQLHRAAVSGPNHNKLKRGVCWDCLVRLDPPLAHALEKP